MIGLTERATVLIRAAGGAYTTEVRTGLRCRLVKLNASRAATADDRAELTAQRELWWEAGYVIPDGARVQIDGITWQTVRNTYRHFADLMPHRRCQVVRVT